MILKSGKFYDSAGNVVPLEFGNKEQRALLDMADALNSGGVALTIVSSKDVISTYFQCLFGEHHAPEINKKFTCKCGYEYRCVDAYPIPAVKFAKK
jgi:hypothetical protein